VAVVVLVLTAAPRLLLVVTAAAAAAVGVAAAVAVAAAAVVVSPNVPCEGVKMKLEPTVVAGKVSAKVTPDFVLCTVFADVLVFSLVKLPPLNENMTLFAMWSSPSDFSSICFVWVEVTSSLFKPVADCISPFKPAVISLESEGTPTGGFWSSLAAGGGNCESCGIPKRNPVSESELVSGGFVFVSDVDGEDAFPELKAMETAAGVPASAVLGILFDVVTLVSPHVNPCIFEEEELSNSFTETLALSIPKLNFMSESDSEPGLAPPHASGFDKLLSFSTVHSI
jgi:hypothetical protein